METYQEEYERIRRDYAKLESKLKNRDSSDTEKNEAQARMSEIFERMNFIRPHAEESARRIGELTDLRNDIAVGRSRLDEVSRILNSHTTVDDIPDEELKTVRVTLQLMTNASEFITLENKPVAEQVSTLREKVSTLREQYVNEENKFHVLYEDYEKFEEEFRKKDPLYVETKDKKPNVENKASTQNIDAESKKIEEEKKEEEREEQEKRKKQEELENKKEELEAKIKELEDYIKMLEDMIKSGKYTQDEIKGFYADIENLRAQIAGLQAELQEIGGKIEALGQAKDEKEKSDDKKSDKTVSKDRKDDEQINKTDQKDDIKLSNGNVTFSQATPPSFGGGSTIIYNNGGVTTPNLSTNPEVQKVSRAVAPNQQLVKKNNFIDIIKEKAKNIGKSFKPEDREVELEEIIRKQEDAEKARRKNYEVIKEEDKRHDADIQMLAFPPARVDDRYFYHTVQIDDKIKYVREPLSGMEFTEEALKRKIIQLQDKYGDVVKERQGRKISIKDILTTKLIDREESGYNERKSYQQFLKKPDKIIKEYLGFSKGAKRQEKIIQLMCGLESANTPEEARYACWVGISSALFSYNSKSKIPFLARANANVAELLAPHVKKQKEEEIPFVDETPIIDEAPMIEEVPQEKKVVDTKETKVKDVQQPVQEQDEMIPDAEEIFDIGEFEFSLPGDDILDVKKIIEEEKKPKDVASKLRTQYAKPRTLKGTLRTKPKMKNHDEQER